MPSKRIVCSPRPAPDPDTLPHPLTIFLSAGERRDVLARLRDVAPDRAQALCTVLNINRTERRAHAE